MSAVADPTTTAPGAAPAKKGRPAARRPGKGKQPSLLGGLPQVNLLPTDVRAGRALGRTKRRLVVALGAVVVVACAGYGGAVLNSAAADAELAEAQTEAAALTAQADVYAEVPAVLAQKAAVETARQSATAGEVLWTDYLDAVTTVLPAGTSIDAVTFTGPGALAVPTTLPLREPGIGTIVLNLRATTLPDVAALQDALDAVPGLSGTWVESVARTAADGGNDYYALTATAQVTTDALAGRFTDGAGS